ncbi:hypothetical protein AB0D11_02760 [Streptomyces monashensis]|uniref:hypothetical protein n=1 Tax=Streptomyces monashensis TaxID=1678012 RepID=UPI0033E99EE7
MSQGAVTEIRPEVLAMMTEYLPPLRGLPDARARGAACVWNGEALTAETAVDLGERVSCGTTLFLRGCYECTGLRAYRAMLDHGSQCPLCASESTAPDCTVGRGLYRLQRECRR